MDHELNSRIGYSLYYFKIFITLVGYDISLEKSRKVEAEERQYAYTFVFNVSNSLPKCERDDARHPQALQYDLLGVKRGRTSVIRMRAWP